MYDNSLSSAERARVRWAALRTRLLCGLLLGPLAAFSAAAADVPHPLVALWNAGQVAFGEYVRPEPVTQESEQATTGQPARYTQQTGEALAARPWLDFAFLSLEQHYDAAAAQAVAEGLRSGGPNSGMSYLVRIPPIATDGVAVARERVAELLALGVDGIVIPHVLSLEEARTAVSFFAGADVWTPQNPQGSVIAMLIVEDPEVFEELDGIAELEGYSALVCGIGSLTSALGGDRAAAEAITLEVLAQGQRVGKPDLITVDAGSVAERVAQGFLALLAYGPDAREVIALGRAAAGRE